VLIHTVLTRRGLTPMAILPISLVLLTRSGIGRRRAVPGLAAPAGFAPRTVVLRRGVRPARAGSACPEDARKGHRTRTLITTAGNLELRIPKLRTGSFFRSTGRATTGPDLVARTLGRIPGGIAGRFRMLVCSRERLPCHRS
jgi:hypothetical protein